MSIQKEISDAEIMQRILEELRYSALAFSKELEYKSHASIDHILKGRNHISESLIDKVVLRFPEVNYWFLKKGQEPILLNDKLKRNQQNLFSKPLNTAQVDYSLESFAVLKNIEKLLIELVDDKNKKSAN
jgi:hypothetical protein